jgi:hypothetical protein
VPGDYLAMGLADQLQIGEIFVDIDDIPGYTKSL